MHTAVKYSVNTYAVQLMDKVGVRAGFDNGQSLGLTLVDSPGKNDLNLAALALGGLTKGVTPLQMVGAYSTFGNSGLYNKPHFIEKIVDGKGTVIYEFCRDPRRVMKEQTSLVMNNMLQEVVQSGTGTKAKVPNVPTAGKTGTSEDLTDAWFCGLTPIYTAAVWMGYDNPGNKMTNIAGGSYPALMFKAIMQKAHQSLGPVNWARSD
jgi:penicillin-binding protein 1A